MGSNLAQDAHQKFVGGFDGCQMEQPQNEIAFVSNSVHQVS